MDLEGSPPSLGSSRTMGGILRGKAFGNALNHADFPRVDLGDGFLAGSAQVHYKVFAYLVYNDPVKLSVIPDSSLPANTIFRVSTVPPLESGVVLKKVANRLDTVAGMYSLCVLLLIAYCFCFLILFRLSSAFQTALPCLQVLLTPLQLMFLDRCLTMPYLNLVLNLCLIVHYLSLILILVLILLWMSLYHLALDVLLMRNCLVDS